MAGRGVARHESAAAAPKGFNPYNRQGFGGDPLVTDRLQSDARVAAQGGES
jgi:hypothetical protein